MFTLITLIVSLVLLAILLLAIGAYAQRRADIRGDLAQVQENRYHRVNWHTTTGTGSRRSSW